MKFILAITTFNRLNYLKNCIQSWENTRSHDFNWKLVVADDGSEDGTIAYLESLKIENIEVVVIKNKRLGVHQQMNTVLNYLETIDYDFFLSRWWYYIFKIRLGWAVLWNSYKN